MWKRVFRMRSIGSSGLKTGLVIYKIDKNAIQFIFGGKENNLRNEYLVDKRIHVSRGYIHLCSHRRHEDN